LPSSWTDRDDSQPGRCPLGPVAGGEDVARLVNDQFWQSGALQSSAFQREFVEKPTQNPSNACGQRGGESLLRIGGRSKADLEALSEVQFQRKPGSAQGAVSANVDAIRQLRIPGVNEQLWYVYEDPTVEDPGHAVIRFSEQTNRTHFTLGRQRLLALFQKL
jgi:hypothetical protein